MKEKSNLNNVPTPTDETDIAETSAEESESVAGEVPCGDAERSATAATEAQPLESVLESQVAEMAQKLDEAKDDYLRLAAEFDNFKKRTAREFAALVKNANERLILELLDILDNFERAFKSREENPDFDAYHKGIRLLYDRLFAVLSREGLQRIESLGQKFDPRYHEAVTQVESEESEPDTVALELLPGYSLNDKVIRHAKVGVAKTKSDG